jgi:hypothetical protein
MHNCLEQCIVYIDYFWERCEPMLTKEDKLQFKIFEGLNLEELDAVLSKVRVCNP